MIRDRTKTGMVRVRVVNCLPETLAHYSRVLVALLQQVGCDVLPSAPVAIEGLSTVGKLQSGLRHLAFALRSADHRTVVAWPVFGLAEPLIWLRHRGRVHVVIHDARPMRRQVGYGRLASCIGVWAQRRGVEVLVHSPAASIELQRRGWEAPTLVAHPVAVHVPRSQSGQTVRVLGQYKPGRDIDSLERLGQHVKAKRLDIVGRGWPPVAGWHVSNAFVGESDFCSLLSSSFAVVVPYRFVWQSGIAVRAIERGVPVVCWYNEGVAVTWGSDWPGFVRHSHDWANAFDRACAVGAAEIESRAAAARDRCEGDWRVLLTGQTSA